MKWMEFLRRENKTILTDLLFGDKVCIVQDGVMKVEDICEEE
jgi:hypothetical protein